MAIAKIKKIRIIAHKSVKETLLDALQETASVHISRISEVTTEIKEDEKQEVSTKLSELDELIKYLEALEPSRGGFLRERPPVKLEEFKKIPASFDYKKIYSSFKELINIQKEASSQKEKLCQRKAKLIPWQALKGNLAEFKATKYTAVICGAIIHKDFGDLLAELDKSKLSYELSQINHDKEFKYILFVCLKDEEASARDILKRKGFSEALFELEKSDIMEELSFIDILYHGLEANEASLNEKLKELLIHKSKLMGLYDYYLNLKAKLDSEENFLNTDHTFFITGWIKERSIKSVKKILEKNFQYLDLDISEPLADEVVPVELENKAALTPFEFITKIYGLPSYGELDPTPFLAPFFFIFFGFCLTDAGYGVIVALLSLWAILKLKPGRYWKTFFWLLFLGGVSTVLLGAVTGGWFGDIVDILNTRFPKIFSFLAVLKNRLILLDPNKEPIKLLGIALGIGVVQIFTGNLIALYDNIRKKHILDGILDQVSVLVFLTGFTGLVLIMLEALNKSYGTLFGRMAQIGALVIILTAGRANPGIGAKLFNGVFAFYNVAAGYISDALSYSRLWALGLVTGVMAMTCNLIAFMIGDMIPLVGFLVTILILFVGHVFTIAINVLGGLIHSGRLQFVEFFPKFFKGGGRVFSPLRLENKYTVIEKS